MSHVVTRPTPPFSAAGGQLTVHQLPAWRDNLVWVIVTEDGRAAVVDGPPVAEALLAFCAERGLRLSWVLNTHAHPDHIGVNQSLAVAGMLGNLTVYGSTETRPPIPGLTDPVCAGDSVRIGGVTGRVLSTPGHVDGHLSYLFGDVLFCGDTLFGGGCGYLFDGPPALMKDSLDQLASLDEEVRVCCAHEYTCDNLRFAWSVEPDNPALRDRIVASWALRAEGGSTVPSTIGLERATNPFLRHDSNELLRHLRAAWPDRALETPAEIFAATRALKDRKDYKTITDDQLPLA